MCFSKWFKKKPKEQSVKPDITPTPQPTPVVHVAPPVVAETPKTEPILTKPVIVEPAPKPEIKVETPKPEPVIIKQESVPIATQPEVVKPAPEVVKPAPDVVKPRYTGKYEIFPEAGLFKFRLKASNGEILVVSQGYTTAKGVTPGIETFVRNVAEGRFEIKTDKSGYSHFVLYNAAGNRLVATGEFYESVKRAESAVESVKKFVGTDKIITLDALPPEEIREELVVNNPIESNPSGKIEMFQEEKQWFARLKASNGEVLFTTTGYTAKSGLTSGIETIRKAVINGNFRVAKDKQGRYQFTLYTSNNQQILVGETYPKKESCLSSVDSVKRFAPEAKIVEAI